MRREKKDYDETIGVGMSGRKSLSGRKYVCICLLDLETISGCFMLA